MVSMDFGVEGLPDRKENRFGAHVFVFCESPDTDVEGVLREATDDAPFFAIAKAFLTGFCVDFTAFFTGLAAPEDLFVETFDAGFRDGFFAGFASGGREAAGVREPGAIRGWAEGTPKAVDGGETGRGGVGAVPDGED